MFFSKKVSKMSVDSQMGEFFFTAGEQKVKKIVLGFVLFCFAVFLSSHIIKGYGEMTFNALVVFSIIVLVSAWYGVSNILNTFMCKIFFYAKGMVVTSCFKKDAIFMTEVKNVKILRYGEDNMVLIFKFEMKNGKQFVVDGRSYENFALKMKEYGEKLNLDWSFPNV